MSDKSKHGYLFSLILHVLIIVLVIFAKYDKIANIPPSKSEMVINLVSVDSVPQNTSRAIKIQTTNNSPIVTNNTANADIHIKDTKQAISKHQAKKAAKLHVIKKKLLTTQSKNKTPKIIHNTKVTPQFNDLIDSMNQGKLIDNNHPSTTPGGTSYGSSNTANLKNNYADAVINKIRPLVIIPDNLSPNARSVIVIVTILPNMQIYNTQLVQSSGNLTYDNNVLEAIYKTNTMPPLPSGALFVQYHKIRLTFNPR